MQPSFSELLYGGGLAIAVLKSVIGGQLGMNLNISRVGRTKMNASERLFSESNGRLLVTIAPDKKQQFEDIMKGGVLAYMGTVTGDKKIHIVQGKKKVVTLSVSLVTRAYRDKFKNH